MMDQIAASRQDIAQWQQTVEQHKQATRQAIEAAANGQVANIAITADDKGFSPTPWGRASAALTRQDGARLEADDEQALALSHMLVLYLALADLAGRAGLLKHNPLIDKIYWWFVFIGVIFFGWVFFKSGLSLNTMGTSSLFAAAGLVCGLGLGHVLNKRRHEKMADAVRRVGKDYDINLDPVADTPERIETLLKPLSFELTRLGDQSFRLPMAELRPHVARLEARQQELLKQAAEGAHA